MGRAEGWVDVLDAAKVEDNERQEVSWFRLRWAFREQSIGC